MIVKFNSPITTQELDAFKFFMSYLDIVVQDNDKKTKRSLINYYDSDYATDEEIRESTINYKVLNNRLIEVEPTKSFTITNSEGNNQIFFEKHKAYAEIISTKTDFLVSLLIKVYSQERFDLLKLTTELDFKKFIYLSIEIFSEMNFLEIIKGSFKIGNYKSSFQNFVKTCEAIYFKAHKEHSNCFYVHLNETIVSLNM